MDHEQKPTFTLSDQAEQPMLPFEMGDIPTSPEDQAKRGWEITVNGEPVDGVTSARLTQSRMGIDIRYGKRPEGYDGVIIREPGGAATIPYMIDDDGRIFIGVVEEYRPTMGEAVTANIPRGFSDFKGTDARRESDEETAKRELHEETGYRALGKSMIKLAEGMNPNSTYFDYSHDRKEGVSLFAVKVPQADLELTHSEEGDVFYAFPAHVRAEAEGDKPAERILGSRFIPLEEALKSRDMFTSAATGQLVARLLAEGEYLLPQNMPQPAETVV
jgi:8-oxo-dGTP pyrophosphatase MutT (NUDIX family)